MDKRIIIAIMLVFFLCINLSFAEDNPYSILRINKNADQSAIKKAFNKLSLKYHPDKNNDPVAKEFYTHVVNAYEILNDPQKKLYYDSYGTVNPGGQNFNSRQGYARQGQPYHY